MNQTDLAEIQAKLGEPQAVFAQDTMRIYIGILVCVVIWIMGTILAYGVFPWHTWFLVGYGVVLSLYASWALRWVSRLIGLKVFVYPQAILVIYRSMDYVFPWENIVHITKKRDDSVVVTRNDGVWFCYSADSLKNSAMLTAIIRKQGEIRGIPWEGKARKQG